MQTPFKSFQKQAFLIVLGCWLMAPLGNALHSETSTNETEPSPVLALASRVGVPIGVGAATQDAMQTGAEVDAARQSIQLSGDVSLGCTASEFEQKTQQARQLHLL